MTLHVVDYLRAGGTYESLLAEHAVHAKPYNGKVSFVYDQLAARDDDALACQCRGLVLREGTWDVVAYPFDRFFNLGQGAAAPIDWATARFEEKRDGTLLIVYWDDHARRWFSATRKCCEGQGEINDSGFTASELADVAAANECVGAATLHDLMEGIGTPDWGVTYMFEMTGPQNRVIVGYPELELTLLGARRLSDFQELDPVKVGDDISFRTVKTWPFAGITDMQEASRSWSPLLHEGVVIRDAAFNRVKMKTPQYVMAHSAVDSLGSSWRSVCAAVLSGFADDLVALVPPAIAERIEIMRHQVIGVARHIERDFGELRSIDNAKEYALAARSRLSPAGLFALKQGKAESATAFLAGIQPDHVLDLCRKVGWAEPTPVSVPETSS